MRTGPYDSKAHTFGVLVLIVMFVLLGGTGGQARNKEWGASYFPNLPVVTQDGKELQFYDDVIKGKIVVISFIYTSCRDLCPLTTARLGLLADRLGDDLGKSIHLVSISVDPANDTPERLKEFASAFHSGPGWLFLTGTVENIRAINTKLGEKMRRLDEHRNEVLVGNDLTGDWMRNSAFAQTEKLLSDVRGMDPAWRDPRAVGARVAVGEGSYPLEATRGQALFGNLCRGCHTIGGGDRVGPDLVGLSSRRSNEWAARYIMSPKQVHSEGDATAKELVGRFPRVRMPNLGLSDLDAQDLLAYIAVRSNR